MLATYLIINISREISARINISDTVLLLVLLGVALILNIVSYLMFWESPFDIFIFWINFI